MFEQSHQIEVDEGVVVTSNWLTPVGWDSARDYTIALAHGAGAGMNSEFMCFYQRLFAEAGLLSLAFNFSYMEQEKRVPDRPPKLLATWQAMLSFMSDQGIDLARSLIGGKSMGGRIATMVAGRHTQLAGLVLLGYPLHPPGKPEKLRSAHLPNVGAPMCFVQGDRDTLCDLALLRPLLPVLAPGTKLIVVEDGDHSFKVRKKSGRTTAQAWSLAANGIIDWIAATAGFARVE